MKQKLYLFTLVLLSQLLSYGQNFTSGGLNYVVTSATEPYTVAVGTHVAADGISLNVTIPETVENSGIIYSVTSISDLAFNDLTFGSLSMGNSITSIGNSAFNGNVQLNSVILSNSLTTIGNLAFYNCTSLTSITIPNSVTTIGLGSFGNCFSLTSITIPNAVTTIGASAFEGCYTLTAIALPNSGTAIGAGAFSGCSALTSIILPNSITTIENSTFDNCSSLTSVTIPNTVTSIGDSAFRSCTSLASISIPNSVTSIGQTAFRSCSSLTSLNIPNSVTSIGNFAFQACTGLTSVTVNWTIPLVINSSTFRNIAISTVTLNVPNGTTAAYQAAVIWQNFNIVTPATHLNFDGVNDYIRSQGVTTQDISPTGETTTVNSFNFTNQMTVEFWMNSNTTPQQWDGLVTKGDDSWRVALTSTGTVAFAGTGAFSDFYSNTSVTDGNWHHVAVTYNGANAIIYIDGVQENSSPATGNIDNSNFAVAIGENLQQTGRLYAGNMDEVRIWNIARTASQISRSKNCELHGNETGLVSYYKFNQGNSGANNSGLPSLLDSSASGNDGDFNGFALNGTSSNFLEGSVVTSGSTIPAAPTASAQTFSISATVSDLVPAPSASILWYNVASGGAALATDVALATGTYYASSVNANGCESERTSVNVTITLTTEAPTTTFSTQIFAGDDKTVADLQVTGDNIIWYNAAIAGAVLPTTTLLVDGTTYYASQTIGGLESQNRVAITVNRISEATQTLATGSAVAALVATPSTGTSVQWFASSTSTDALDNAVTLATGTYFVEQVTPNLNVSTLTGTTQGFSDGDPSIAKFNQPYNMDFDADGNIYVADYINNRIRKVTPSGVVTTVAGAGPNGFADGNGANAFFNIPTDLVVDKVAGLIYVTDANNNAIRIVSFAGDVTTLTAGLGSGFADGNLSNAQFHYPSGIVRDLAGNLYISDQNNNRIRKITVAGNVSTLAGNGDGTSVDGTGIGASLYGPAGIDFDIEGNLYVIEYDGFNLRKITTSGVVTTVVTGAAAGFLYPNGLAIDSQNNILIADTDNSLIKKVTPNGNVSVFAGSSAGFSDGPALSAAFRYPTGIAINNLGEIFIADTYNHKIRKITNDAIATNRVAVAVVIEEALTLTAAAQTNVSCFGTATGSATVNEPTNGTAPYTYDWTGSPIGDGTTSISQLSAGVYVCTVTDAAGNTAMQSFTITQPMSFGAIGNVSSNISCFGGNDGGVTVEAFGGVAPYSYLWNTGQNTATIPDGLTAGIYSVTVTDANGCSEQINLLLVNPSNSAVTGVVNNHVTCPGGNNGAATVNVNVSEDMVNSYAWSNGATTKIVTGLSAGVYLVNVTFTNGCVTTAQVTITQPAAFSGTVLSQTNVSCFGAADGGATVEVSGGTPPYNYQWSNGQNTPTLSNVSASTYSLRVTDANGCGIIPGIGIGTTVATVTITQPVQLTVPTAAANQTLCSGLSVADLEPYANATIKWFAEANATTPLNNATLLVSGTTYYVASTNANGCQSNKVASTVTLTAAPPTPTIAGVTTQDFADINISATGECQEAGGLYLYKGTSNGKNKYESAFYSPAKLAYNATTSKWQLYVNSIDNVLFENSTTNDDLFPPATGWVGQSFCSASILTIDTVTYSQRACEGSNASVLNPAPSSSINWYNSGGWPVFANDALVAGLYYVAFVNSEGCESPRTPVSFSYAPKSMPPLVAGGLSDSSIIVTITGACADSSGNYEFDGNIVNGKHSYTNQMNSVIEFNGINWQLKNEAGDILFENVNIPGLAPPATGWIPSCSGVMNMAFNFTEQILCPGATAADIVATGTNLVYFNDSSQQIPSTTVLTDTQYRVASIGANGCLSEKIYVSILLEVPAVVYPTSVAFDSGLYLTTSGDCPFSIPSGPYQFVDVDANGKSTYINDGNGNSFIAFDDTIQKWKFYHNNGTIYFYNDDTTGLVAPATGWYPVDCTNSSLDAIIYTKFAQSFCGNATVADLTATGTNYNWYYNPSGGTPLDNSQPLFNNQQYYVSATGVGGCESPRRRLEVKVVNSPTANAQTFCGSTTVANLVATGQNLKWYADNVTTDFLQNTAIVSTGTYYVSQTVGSCETPRTAVAVTVTPGTTTGSVTTSICAGQSYTWPANGQTYTTAQSGVTVVNGCSTATLNLTITTGTTWYADADNDTFGNPMVTQTSCDQPLGYVSNSLDCNDAVFAINPAATEICWNNIDDNCNNIKSEGCAAIPVYINNPAPISGLGVGTISNFAISLSAVPYTYPGATSLDYRFEVTNISVTPNQTIEFTQTGAFARYFTIPVAIRGFNTTYTIRASAVINGEEVPYVVPVITVVSTGIPTVKLSPTSCGATLSRLNATISADPGFNATSYEFRIRKTSDTAPIPTYYYAHSLTRFIGANSFNGLSLQYSTSYSVSVRYTTPSVGTALTPESSLFGDECIIVTPSIPLISLSSPICGSSLDRFGATISASPATYAQQYQFRVRLTSDNGGTPTYYTTIPNASRYSSLMSAQGLVLAYSTQYSVSVRYSIPVVGSLIPEWSDYGSECIVVTPMFPTTEVSAGQCGAAVTDLNQTYTINVYPGNPMYSVKLERIEGSSLILVGTRESSTPSFKINMFVGTSLGVDYSVSVALRINGELGPYGRVCDLAAPSSARVQATLFSVVAYPNPFSEGFQLNIKTENDGLVSIKTYDMIGRLIEERSSKVNKLESISIGANYPSGVYNVIVSQDDDIRTVRVVKR